MPVVIGALRMQRLVEHSDKKYAKLQNEKAGVLSLYEKKEMELMSMSTLDAAVENFDGDFFDKVAKCSVTSYAGCLSLIESGGNGLLKNPGFTLYFADRRESTNKRLVKFDSAASAFVECTDAFPLDDASQIVMRNFLDGKFAVHKTAIISKLGHVLYAPVNNIALAIFSSLDEAEIDSAFVDGALRLCSRIGALLTSTVASEWSEIEKKLGGVSGGVASLERAWKSCDKRRLGAGFRAWKYSCKNVQRLRSVVWKENDAWTDSKVYRYLLSSMYSASRNGNLAAFVECVESGALKVIQSLVDGDVDGISAVKLIGKGGQEADLEAELAARIEAVGGDDNDDEYGLVLFSEKQPKSLFVPLEGGACLVLKSSNLRDQKPTFRLNQQLMRGIKSNVSLAFQIAVSISDLRGRLSALERLELKEKRELEERGELEHGVGVVIGECVTVACAATRAVFGATNLEKDGAVSMDPRYFYRCLKEAVDSALGKCFVGCKMVCLTSSQFDPQFSRTTPTPAIMVVEISETSEVVGELVLEFENEEYRRNIDATMTEPLEILKCLLSHAYNFAKVSASAASVITRCSERVTGVNRDMTMVIEQSKHVAAVATADIATERSMNARIAISSKLRSVMEDVVSKGYADLSVFYTNMRLAVEEASLEVFGDESGGGGSMRLWTVEDYDALVKQGGSGLGTTAFKAISDCFTKKRRGEEEFTKASESCKIVCEPVTDIKSSAVVAVFAVTDTSVDGVLDDKLISEITCDVACVVGLYNAVTAEKTRGDTSSWRSDRLSHIIRSISGFHYDSSNNRSMQDVARLLERNGRDMFGCDRVEVGIVQDGVCDKPAIWEECGSGLKRVGEACYFGLPHASAKGGSGRRDMIVAVKLSGVAAGNDIEDIIAVLSDVFSHVWFKMINDSKLNESKTLDGEFKTFVEVLEMVAYRLSRSTHGGDERKMKEVIVDVVNNKRIGCTLYFVEGSDLDKNESDGGSGFWTYDTIGRVSRILPTSELGAALSSCVRFGRTESVEGRVFAPVSWDEGERRVVVGVVAMLRIDNGENDSRDAGRSMVLANILGAVITLAKRGRNGGKKDSKVEIEDGEPGGLGALTGYQCVKHVESVLKNIFLEVEEKVDGDSEGCNTSLLRLGEFGCSSVLTAVNRLLEKLALKVSTDSRDGGVDVSFYMKSAFINTETDSPEFDYYVWGCDNTSDKVRLERIGGVKSGLGGDVGECISSRRVVKSVVVDEISGEKRVVMCCPVLKGLSAAGAGGASGGYTVIGVVRAQVVVATAASGIAAITRNGGDEEVVDEEAKSNLALAGIETVVGGVCNILAILHPWAHKVGSTSREHAQMRTRIHGIESALVEKDREMKKYESEVDGKLSGHNDLVDKYNRVAVQFNSLKKSLKRMQAEKDALRKENDTMERFIGNKSAGSNKASPHWLREPSAMGLNISDSAGSRTPPKESTPKSILRREGKASSGNTGVSFGGLFGPENDASMFIDGEDESLVQNMSFGASSPSRDTSASRDTSRIIEEMRADNVLLSRALKDFLEEGGASLGASASAGGETAAGGDAGDAAGTSVNNMSLLGDSLMMEEAFEKEETEKEGEEE
jgi:hypothetical protein